MSLVGRILALASLFLTAACPQLPQPFQHDAVNPLLRLDGRAGVFLVFDASVPTQLSPAIRAGLMKQDVPVFLDTPPAEAFPLHLRFRKSAPRGGTVELELFWELQDAEGLAVGHYDQRLRVMETEWDGGDPLLMKRLASEASPHLAQLMPVEDGTRPAADVAQASLRPRLFLAAVEGAQGDGNDALARAMRLSLSASGIELADSAAGAFHLKGAVQTSKADSKSEKLHVAWTLFDSKGAEMAALEQEGVVPQGLLQKPWGALAGEIVAGTAIELSGILKDAVKKR